jgi:hypothetical protein
MESLKNWDGDVMRGVTYAPDRRQGTNRFFMVKSERGQYRKLTDWQLSYAILGDEGRRDIAPGPPCSARSERRAPASHQGLSISFEAWSR